MKTLWKNYLVVGFFLSAVFGLNACSSDSSSSADSQPASGISGMTYVTKEDPATGKKWIDGFHTDNPSDDITCAINEGCFFGRESAKTACPTGFRLPTAEEFDEYSQFASITMDGYYGGNPIVNEERNRQVNFWAYDDVIVRFKKNGPQTKEVCNLKTDICVDGSSRFHVVCVEGDEPSCSTCNFTASDDIWNVMRASGETEHYIWHGNNAYTREIYNADGSLLVSENFDAPEFLGSYKADTYENVRMMCNAFAPAHCRGNEQSFNEC